VRVTAKVLGRPDLDTYEPTQRTTQAYDSTSILSSEKSITVRREGRVVIR
jgi:hypothetical protein